MFITTAASVLDLIVSSPSWVEDRAVLCTPTLVHFDAIAGLLQFNTACAGSRNSWIQTVVYEDWESIVMTREPAAPLTPELEEEIGEETKVIEEETTIVGTESWPEVLTKFPQLVNMDVKVHCNCLTGDTKIPLLDGRTLTLKEIHKEFGTKKHFWVYSTDKNGDFKPGKAYSLGVTKRVTKLYHITLDNGECIKCTEDHPFMLRTGEYTQAKDLKVNESLMPLYFKDAVIYSKKSVRTYKQYRINSTNKWKFVFRTVAEEIYPTEKLEKIGSVHHVNFNQNAPNNHKITKIEIKYVDDPIPVYDISVEKWENFVLDAGVVVHNCPAFLWWGSWYNLDQRDTSLFPEGVPYPHVRDPSLNNIICKHLAAVFANHF